MNTASNTCTPVAPTASIVAELELLIRRRTSGRIRNAQVRLLEHGLVLTGFTPNYYVKQLAQQAILESTQMPILRNEIEVEGQ